MTRRLAEVYGKYFVGYPEVNDQPDRLREVFRLRYQAYCLENSLEDPSRFTNNLVTDQFDGCSIHSLPIHRQTQIPADPIKLVRLAMDGPQQSLLINSACAATHTAIYQHLVCKSGPSCRLSGHRTVAETMTGG